MPGVPAEPQVGARRCPKTKKEPFGPFRAQTVRGADWLLSADANYAAAESGVRRRFSPRTISGVMTYC